MRVLTNEHPKCMTEIYVNETILSRQLKCQKEYGITYVIIATGYFDNVLIDYCNFLDLHMNIIFVNNLLYDKANYIYLIYCTKENLKDQDIFLLHGDLVFEERVLNKLLLNVYYFTYYRCN